MMCLNMSVVLTYGPLPQVGICAHSDQPTNTRYCTIQAGCCPRVATVDGHQTAVVSGAAAQAVPKTIASIAGNTPSQ